MAATRENRRRSAESETEPPLMGAVSKLDRMLALLARPEGASLAELVVVTGWRTPSVRGALAGALKRKGHAIRSEKLGGERRYHIEAKR